MTMTLSDILELVEFTYVINEDKTLSLVDDLGANLGGIESETYNITPDIAMVLIDRLENYFEDYIFADLREQYESLGYGKLESNLSISEYINAIKAHEEFEYKLTILECLENTDKIDITELNV